jgi:hypothetical protein
MLEPETPWVNECKRGYFASVKKLFHKKESIQSHSSDIVMLIFKELLSK